MRSDAAAHRENGRSRGGAAGRAAVARRREERAPGEGGENSGRRCDQAVQVTPRSFFFVNLALRLSCLADDHAPYFLAAHFIIFTARPRPRWSVVETANPLFPP